MLLYILALFVVVPFVELVLLLWIADRTSWQFTVGLVLITGVIGSVLARRQGLGIWVRMQRQLQKGEIPGREIADGLLVLIAGALLITPGVLTDAVGFLLLVPWTRAVVRKSLLKYMVSRAEWQARTFVYRSGSVEERDDDYIDSYATRPRDSLDENDEPNGDSAPSR